MSPKSGYCQQHEDVTNIVVVIFEPKKSLKLGCPFKLLQKVKPDWQLAADLTDFMFMNPPSLMSIYMGVAKWRYLKIIVFSNTKKKALKGKVQSTLGTNERACPDVGQTFLDTIEKLNLKSCCVKSHRQNQII